MASATSNANSFDWSKIDCNVSPKEIAKEVVNISVMGSELEKKSSCLDRKDFKYLNSIYDPVEEQKSNFKGHDVFYVDSMDDVKIERVKKLKTWHYEVLFSVKSRGKTFKEKAEFLILKEPTQKSRHACAGPLVVPKRKYLLKRCRLD